MAETLHRLSLTSPWPTAYVSGNWDRHITPLPTFRVIPLTLLRADGSCLAAHPETWKDIKDGSLDKQELCQGLTSFHNTSLVN